MSIYDKETVADSNSHKSEEDWMEQGSDIELGEEASLTGGLEEDVGRTGYFQLQPAPI